MESQVIVLSGDSAYVLLFKPAAYDVNCSTNNLLARADVQDEGL